MRDWLPNLIRLLGAAAIVAAWFTGWANDVGALIALLILVVDVAMH